MGLILFLALIVGSEAALRGEPALDILQVKGDFMEKIFEG